MDKDRRRGVRRAYLDNRRRKIDLKIAYLLNLSESQGTHYVAYCGYVYTCKQTPEGLVRLQVWFKKHGLHPEKTWVHPCDCYNEYKTVRHCPDCQKQSRWKAGELRMNDEYQEWIYGRTF